MVALSTAIEPRVYNKICAGAQTGRAPQKGGTCR